jgi:hypothetical protein
LKHVEDVEEDMLGKVAHRDHKKRAGLVRYPGIVRFRGGDFCRQTETTILKLFDTISYAFQDEVKAKASILLPFGKSNGIPRIEKINTFVIGKEGLTRMKAGRRGKVRPPAAPE